MKDLTITAIIKVYQYDELNEADRALVTTAKEATARSYVPYSHFSVGAALESQINDMKADNDARYKQITTSVEIGRAHV